MSEQSTEASLSSSAGLDKLTIDDLGMYVDDMLDVEAKLNGIEFNITASTYRRKISPQNWQLRPKNGYLSWPVGMPPLIIRESAGGLKSQDSRC